MHYPFGRQLLRDQLTLGLVILAMLIFTLVGFAAATIFFQKRLN